MEFLFWASLTGVHLSRVAEDLIIYSTAEFGFVKLSDAYSTGSSLMPQKKNPDAMELVRGKSGRPIGSLMTLFTVVKGLPSTYNKDLQEDKEPLFDAVDTMRGVLPICEGVISTLTINEDRMLASLDAAMLATDLADYLVRKGVPFRETHHIAGRAVQLAEDTGVKLTDLTPDQLRTLHSAFEDDVTGVWDFTRSVESRDSPGGTSKSAVQQQIADMRAWIETQRD
ncbi:ARG7 [Symbiodinium sp. KB8]|nr:ARG7 [Symbiodinium sp. KB8]